MSQVDKSEFSKLTINVFGESYAAMVRRSLVVEDLLREILRRFHHDLDENQTYVLTSDGEVLKPNKSVDAVVKNGLTELNLTYLETAQTHGKLVLNDPQEETRVMLIDLRTHQSFEVLSFPAILGRVSQGSGFRPSVDLSALPENQTVSRQHAEIDIRDGAVYIRGLRHNNPIVINDSVKKEGVATVISHDDIIQLGKAKLRVEVVIQSRPP